MDEEQIQSLKSVTNVIYGLQALSFLFGFTAIVGVVVNYIKQADVQDTWLASHFRWQIRTFWFGLLWVVIGTVLSPIGVGFLILAVAAVWFIYRIVKGWLRLMERREMYSR